MACEAFLLSNKKQTKNIYTPALPPDQPSCSLSADIRGGGGGGLGPPGRWKPQASWWSQPTRGAPFWARPSWMSRMDPAQDGLWTPPRGRLSSQQGIRGSVTLGPGWWAIPPSSPSPPPSHLKGGGTTGSGRHSRDTWPACPSGRIRRPIWEITGTLLPHRSRDFGRGEHRQLRQVGGLPTAGPAPTRKRRRGEADAATPASQSL
jgi:hypothetical protein